jgi:hypothetical protein
MARTKPKRIKSACNYIVKKTLQYLTSSQPDQSNQFPDAAQCPNQHQRLKKIQPNFNNDSQVSASNLWHEGSGHHIRFSNKNLASTPGAGNEGLSRWETI